jgi:uncharacterized protein (DUF1330 family)
MPGYIIARFKITDLEKYKDYMKATPASVEKYGGEIIVRGGDNFTLEGPIVDERVVVIKFESLEKAKAWYYSDEYQTAKILRNGAAIASFYAIAGN